MIDTKALKEKILDMAMRGKLVEQDDNDEPASELLKRIKAEKEELIKQKKIKRDKNETEIFKADDDLYYEKYKDDTVKKIDVPYKLPKGWEITRLPKIVKLENGSIKRGPFGSSIKKSMFVPKTEDTYKVYEQGNAIKKTYAYGNYYLNKDDFDRLIAFEIKPRDIIISCAGTIGKYYVIPKDAPKGVINQALLRLRINENIIDINYFLLLFEHKVEKLNDDAAGTAIKNLGSVKYLKNELIWLIPPLAEQKRIADKIEELFALIDTIEENQVELQNLAKQLEQKTLDIAMRGKLVEQDENDEPASVLLEKIKAEKQRLFEEGKLKKKDLQDSEIIKTNDNIYYEKNAKGELKKMDVPYELPDSWIYCKLNDVAFLQMGQSPKGTNIHDEFKINSIEFHQGKTYFSKSMLKESNKWTTQITKLISPPAVIMSVRAPVGDANMVIDRSIVIGRGLACIKPYLSNIFLFYYFLSNMKKLLEQKSTGTTFKAINIKTLQDILFILPPLAEQKRIVNKINEIFEQIEVLGN